MEFAGEYILSKVLLLTESIARRAFQKAGDQANNRCGPERNRALNDMMMAVEKETTQILDCLASQQQSKVASANQFVKLAMSDLQAWNEEVVQATPPYHFSTSLSSQNSETTSSFGSLSISSNFSVSAPKSSQYFRNAMRQLWDADKWCTEAFNDKRNTKRYVRIEALHIRLFCRALLDWDNKRLWFAKWRQVLEPFFSEREFVQYAMGEQSIPSKIFSDERAKSVSDRFIHLTKCLEALIWSMLLHEPWLAPFAREFAIHFDKHTTLASDVKLLSNWSGLRTFHLSYYDLTEDIELKLCADRLVIRLYEFKCITASANGHVWAVEHTGRMVSFDAKNPQAQYLVSSDEKRWLSLGYASDKKKIYATAEGDTHISVFDAINGKLIENEKYDLPAISRHAYAYQIKVCAAGTILLCHKGSGKGFVMFPDAGNFPIQGEDNPAKRHSKWLSLKNGEYDVILQADANRVIGLKMKGFYLTGDLIRNASVGVDEAVVSDIVQERINLPHEPQAYLLAAAVDGDTSVDGCRITVVCKTEKLNYMISIGMQCGKNAGEPVRFSVKDVCSFDTKYTDWQMVKDMIEVDGKLFMLFR